MTFGGVDFKDINDGVFTNSGKAGFTGLEKFNTAAKRAAERIINRSEWSKEIADENADASLNLSKMRLGLTDGDIFQSDMEKVGGIVGSLDELGLFDSFSNKKPVQDSLSSAAKETGADKSWYEGLGSILSGWG
tara:strand:- start:372 stop:773 length:402 start_codon:yes stop_codon:yes gene_type:complete